MPAVMGAPHKTGEVGGFEETSYPLCGDSFQPLLLQGSQAQGSSPPRLSLSTLHKFKETQSILAKEIMTTKRRGALAGLPSYICLLKIAG